MRLEGEESRRRRKREEKYFVLNVLRSESKGRNKECETLKTHEGQKKNKFELKTFHTFIYIKPTNISFYSPIE